MQTKELLYAAVGAPVVAARKVGDKVSGIRTRLSEGAGEYGRAAERAIGAWAAEGEKVWERVTDRRMVDELTAKVDLDQAKEQVTRLRDQLEDMLDTWRSSFRPEGSAPRAGGPTPKTTAAPAGTEPAPEPSPSAKTSSSKTSSPKTGGGATTRAKAPAAKTAKSTAAKKSPVKPTGNPTSKAS